MAGVSDLSFDDLPEAGKAAPMRAQDLSFDDIPHAPRSAWEQLGRQLGLTVRAGAQGVAAIPNAIGDVVGLRSSDSLNALLDKFLPTPENGTERFANAVAGGMVQPGAVAKIAPQLAARLGTQVAASGAAAGSSELAKDAGAGPWGQMGAGLAGGIVAPSALAAAGTGLQGAGRFASNLVRPFFDSGRKDIAARLVQGAANSPQEAAASIDSARRLVPGVNPTTAELSNDSGVSGLYKTVRNQNPGVFSDLEAANDAARQQALKDVFGTPTDITLAQDARTAATTPLRDAAFADASNVDTKPIVKLGTSMLDAGAKYRGQAGTLLQGFVDDIKGIKDPQVLYNGPRKAINDVLSGQASRDTPLAQFTTSELTALKNQIDAQIEKAAPGFKNYLQTYSGMSREIDKAQLGQTIAKDSTNPLTERLSPAGFARNFQNNAEDIAKAGPVASDALTRINEDLKRSVAPMAAMRTAGSDTTQNTLASDALKTALGNLPGGPVSRGAMRFVTSLYSPQQEAVRQLVLKGVIDPQTGKMLLSRPLAEQQDLLAQLLGRAKPIAFGGLLGSVGAQ